MGGFRPPVDPLSLSLRPMEICMGIYIRLRCVARMSRGSGRKKDDAGRTGPPLPVRPPLPRPYGGE
jgi:hypothetical protein